MEEMEVMTMCLQNLVMCSQPIKQNVAEADGLQVVLDLISCSLYRYFSLRSVICSSLIICDRIKLLMKQ